MPVSQKYKSPVSQVPYQKPVLREYGTVAAVTASASMAGTSKDGGSNNTKT